MGLSQLAARVSGLEASHRRVTGKATPVPVVEQAESPIQKAIAACRAAGVSEEAIEDTAAPLRLGDPEVLAEAMEALAEEDTIGGRLKRSGLDRWA